MHEEIFKDKENGVFVEIGACDGIKLSNTFFFEKNKNWTGICVEPRKKQFELLIKNRTCVCENICISNNPEEEFLEFEGGWLEPLSGLKRNFHPLHVKKILEGLSYGNQACHKKNIEAMRLDDLFSKHKLNHIDYCSIDTEGSELEILHTINFNEVTIHTFSIENNFDSKEIQNFLQKKGYEKIMEIGIPRTALDEIYKKIDF